MAKATTPEGRRLRTLRKTAGLTATELAEKSGVDASMISRIETGAAKRPSASVVAALSKALGASILVDAATDDGATQESDPFPSRAEVIALARGVGAPVHVLEALRIEKRLDGKDPGRDYWRERLRDLSRTAEQIRADLLGDVSPDVGRPPLLRKSK